MKSIIDVFRMTEVSSKARANIIVKLGESINAQHAMNLTEPLVAELVFQLDPKHEVLSKEMYSKHLTELKKMSNSSSSSIGETPIEYKGATIKKGHHIPFEWTHPKHVCKETDGMLTGFCETIEDCKEEIDLFIDDLEDPYKVSFEGAREHNGLAKLRFNAVLAVVVGM